MRLVLPLVLRVLVVQLVMLRALHQPLGARWVAPWELAVMSCLVRRVALLVLRVMVPSRVQRQQMLRRVLRMQALMMKK